MNLFGEKQFMLSLSLFLHCFVSSVRPTNMCVLTYIRLNGSFAEFNGNLLIFILVSSWFSDAFSA